MVGVNDAVILSDKTTATDEDFCLGVSVSAMVSSFRSWISSYVGLGVDCRQDERLCACPEACDQQTGICEINACADREVHCYDMLVNHVSRGSISGDAYERDLYGMSIDAYDRFVEMMECMYEHGDEQGGHTPCLWQTIACNVDSKPETSGTEDCYSVMDCAMDCAGDETCVEGCLSNASEEAIEPALSLYYCVQLSVSPDATAEEWRSVMASTCDDFMYACAPKQFCTFSKGDCAAGTACSKLSWGYHSCRKTAGLELGALCNADAVECKDGEVCAPSSQEASIDVCTKACQQKSQCDRALDCDMSLQDMLGTGFCPQAPIASSGENASAAGDDALEKSDAALADGDPDAEDASDASADGCSALPESRPHGLCCLLLGLPFCLRRRPARPANASAKADAKQCNCDAASAKADAKQCNCDAIVF